ncbi:MAG: AMP-binding protein, partial [Clostridia bacterium]
MNFKAQNQNMKRPWLNYYASPSIAELTYPDGTMYDAFREAALQNPEAAAIDYNNIRISFRELHQQVLRCAKALQELGAGRGDRITVCLPNIPQAVIVFYAILYIGAEANMIHPLSAGNEIEFYVNMSKSSILFMFDAFFGKLDGIRCPSLRKTVFAGAADLLPVYMRAGFRLTQGRKIKTP